MQGYLEDPSPNAGNEAIADFPDVGPVAGQLGLNLDRSHPTQEQPLFVIHALVGRHKDDLLEDVSGRRLLRDERQLQATDEPVDDGVLHTFPAHLQNSGSFVMPQSSMIASYSARPGNLRPLLGSPVWRCLTTSEVRLNELHLLTLATCLPSCLILNLEFLYGSDRWGLTMN